MPLAIHRRRSPLPRFRRALKTGVLRVGFLGGSITDQKTGRRWPEPVLAWLGQRYPSLRLVVENAAIGATGSDLAAFRAGRDIVARDCDLVFVEYAVNDQGTPPERRARAREGVLRQLLAEARDVVLVYTFMPEHLADLRDGRDPASVADFERLADHYSLPAVYVGLHAWREVERGLLRWEEWLPDNLHPEERGSLSYAQAVIAHLETSLALPPASATTPAAPIPAPLDARNWENVSMIPYAEIARTGPWSERRWGQLNWIDQVLHTTGPGATLRTRFTGHTLVAATDFGSLSSELRWRIDGGEWSVTARARPAWCGTSGWFRVDVLAEDLADGEHTLELETALGVLENVTGCTTRIAFLGVVR
ncbi:MAG: GDSL-type esterase/lipase family protein [Opitutaceae bacterium]|jgi:hypothetical protein|nr:GDSL-type esterase/lipase family protein [Opitutaceae bacterium]